jgi:hypothetical protein
MWSRSAAYHSGGAAPISSLFLLVLPDIRRFHAGYQAPLCLSAVPRSRSFSGLVCLGIAMRSLDEFAGEKLSVLDARAASPHAGGNRARRHLGRAGRPPFAVVLLQRLSQSQPASGRRRGGDRGDRALRRRRRRLAPGHRQSSAVRANSKAGWRGSRAPRRPAFSAPAISPIPASYRRWSARRSHPRR